MKPHSLYAQLELIPADDYQTRLGNYPVKSAWILPKQWLGQVGQVLLAWLCGSADPQVTIKCDRTGQPVFTVYDPFDQVHRTFTTEQDLRIWLEKRYYQS